MGRSILHVTFIGAMLIAITLAGMTIPPESVSPLPRGPLVGLAILFQCAAVVLRSINWRQLIGLIRPMPFETSLRATLIGMAANGLLPLRMGEFLRAYLLGNHLGISRMTVFASVLLERFFDTVILSSLLLITSVALLSLGLPGAGWMLAGALLIAVAGLLLLLLLYLFGSRDARVLALLGSVTGIFNDRWRDELRIGLWSAGHFIRLMLSQPMILARFAMGLVAVWASQLCALLLLLLFMLPEGEPFARIGQALSAYVAVSLPSAPASVGSFQAIFILLSTRLEPAMPDAAHLAFWVWALMMLPITICGTVIYLANPLFGVNRGRSLSAGHHATLLRDRPRAREMSEALASYFSGLKTMRAVQDRELTDDDQLRSQFKGGSDQLTVMVEQSERLIVRKIAPVHRTTKLQAQRDWLQRHAGTGLVPPVLDWDVTKDTARLDIGLLQGATNFYAALHAMTPEHAAALILHLISRLEGEIYRSAPEIEDPVSTRRYIDGKISGKLAEAMSLLPDVRALMEAPRLTVNGREVLGVGAAVERILADPRMMADLSRQRPSDIHGDLTIDNLLLVDDELRLIDPNDENAITDPVVDYAKLAQSLHSGYEFLIEVRHISVTDTVVAYPAYLSAAYAAVWHHVRAGLETRLTPHAARALLFHEGVHYMRMLPYRARIRPETAAMFYAIAACRFQDFIEQYPPA